MTTRKARPKAPATPQDAAATSGDVARPSLLRRGAPPPGTPPSEPWFKNDDKLLAAVVARAAQDQAFAGRVAAAVGKLAQQQPGLRKKLHMSAAGGKRGAPGRTQARLAMVADTYLMFRERQQRGAAAEVVRWVLGVPSVFGITTETGAKRLLAAARREFPNGSSGGR